MDVEGQRLADERQRQIHREARW